MQQCHSGGFIDNLRNAKTFIATACSANQSAYRADTECETYNGKKYSHGEFNYHIITALSGKTPLAAVVNASTDANPLVSALEAYNWEVTHESSASETPQMDNSGGIGSGFYLK